MVRDGAYRRGLLVREVGERQRCIGYSTLKAAPTLAVAAKTDPANP